MVGSNTYKSFTIFLSSPGDVSAERERARQIIDSVNKTIRDLLHINFHVLAWEGLPPETPNPNEGTIQDNLNKLVEKSHIFLLILNKRYGTVEPGHTKSNTERELDTIMAKHASNPKVSILTYFKTIEDNKDPGQQELKVREFRRRLQTNGVLFKEFLNYQDFSDKFTHDLYAMALKLNLSPFKADCLGHFWNIPSRSAPLGVDVAIVYRPMDLDCGNYDRTHWHRRLMPGVTLEDTKAIQKVQKNLRMLGLRGKVHRSVEMPPNIHAFNRLWICSPRVPMAAEYLRKYGDRVRFSFERKGGKESVLKWITKDGDVIHIKSPLAKYLKLQRKHSDASGDWNSAQSRIVAKDFGVVARFEGGNDDDTKDFVVAGIRGLGTWGGAWYLDRKYKELRALSGCRDVQILVEVIYKDGMIMDVRNVSDAGADYFEAEHRDRRIRGVIAGAKHGGVV